MVLVTFAAAVLLVALWLTVGRGARAGSGDASAAEGGVVAASEGVRTVVVEPGDTLWEIAVGVDSGADPRVIVQRVMDLNGLSDAFVQPGQELRLPER
ncbi:LysM peptidoglycan-binding domain-containing protein [Spirillospora sp. NBC_01491]|uniref:LysM peptidoglycan-binding domain-containing protein n=1 Tax=Spirillospora sp. NBC_01491 TaxID=2976007 RepID=UPI002E374FD7|nr:LysM peptidoglycan-binding domain-containing protein [Spirillospora sp. NBC_01491]